MSDFFIDRNTDETAEVTVELPAWLDQAAAAQGIDLAQTLQEALKEQLHLLSLGDAL